MNGDDVITRAERELLAYVEALREHPPRGGDELVGAVIATARWQAVARPYLSTIGVVASAFGLGAQALLGSPRRR